MHPAAVIPATGRRKRLWVTALTVTLVIVAGAVGVMILPHREPSAASEPPPFSTVSVTSGDMVAETKVVGAIAYSASTTVTVGAGGVVTELPPPGTPVAAGGVLYRVDTRPVILLAGSVPAWRDLASGIDDGLDVLQLEQNLAAFGLFDEAPDTAFDWDTTVAIRDWQESLGLERTGVVERAMVLFWNGPLRVDELTATIGQEVGPGTALYRATSIQKVVDVAVKSSDRELAVLGQAVTVTLPGGSTIDGMIQVVGEPVSRPGSDGAPPTVVIPVRVSVDDQEALVGLALATVTVSFDSALRDDVLTVPVDALVPLDETHYAVELPPAGDARRGTLVPVSTGAVASGLVEISGKGIVAGLTVVVPAR